MKRILILGLIALQVVSCQSTKKDTSLVFSVNAVRETVPVQSNDDAADDACVWINQKDVNASLIIGTNKKQGLCTYNLQGELLNNDPVGKVNNVDIRDHFYFKGDTISVVTASNRTNNTITVHQIHADGTLENIAKDSIKSNLKEVYGLCMYQNSGNTYVFISGKDGGVEKWQLIAQENGVVGVLISTIFVGSQTEGMVADDELGFVYIAEEDVALWKYNANNLEETRTLVAKTSDVNMKDDFEGVTLYKQENNTGFVILSSQGNNSYAMFDRVTNKYIKSFTLEDGGIDGTNDTDGIDVTSGSFKDFPKGFFIAQDGTNMDGSVKKNQNFKIVDFRDVLEGL
ncbi:phytase [Wenyingzhuangia marina]|uniref:3-phytase n=1 Tax=Wenyingzhuangia marina TaxID=1195760 RepID=A0A1M5V633_9FLAO|nr:phytase [Wenyingzhuangia marina]GGF74131.1 3-phytase [Wenyingzhuangia marina]SHH70695.1 3-phytase [Wenyingzhuangia marina]